MFVFVGDSPLITKKTIKALKDHHLKTQADCTFLTSQFPLTYHYARVVRNKMGKLIKSVEEKDATEKELEISEASSSHFIFKANKLFQFLYEIKPDLHDGEYYLIDIVNIFLDHGLKVETLFIEDHRELVGLNTPEELAWAENILRQG